MPSIPRPALVQWLLQSGYQYSCFISYARAPAASTVEVVLRPLAERVTGILQDEAFPLPVFFHADDIAPGSGWERRLAEGIASSVCMAAMCAPLYFDPARQWPAREWATKSRLCSAGNLPAGGHILPILMRDLGARPPAAFAAIQLPRHDLRKALRGTRPSQSNAFLQVCEDVARHCIVTAEALYEHRLVAPPAPPTLDTFPPANHPFEDWGGNAPVLPSRQAL